MLFEKLSRNVVIADWQYWVKNSPVQSALLFKEKGFETLCCPWDRTFENCIATAETAKQYALIGIIHTTWQSLSMGTYHVAFSARLAWEKESKLCNNFGYEKACLANALRKICFPDGVYENMGWSEKQIQEFLE